MANVATQVKLVPSLLDSGPTCLPMSLLATVLQVPKLKLFVQLFTPDVSQPPFWQLGIGSQPR